MSEIFPQARIMSVRGPDILKWSTDWTDKRDEVYAPADIIIYKEPAKYGDQDVSQYNSNL